MRRTLTTYCVKGEEYFARYLNIRGNWANNIRLLHIANNPGKAQSDAGRRTQTELVTAETATIEVVSHSATHLDTV